MEHKPLYRNIYKILNIINPKIPSMMIEEYLFDNDSKNCLIFQRLMSNWYIEEKERTSYDLKKEYKDMVGFDEQMEEEYVLETWNHVPQERYYESSDLYIFKTLKWKLFLENYSTIFWKINYFLEDYNKISNITFWFLWWIMSSLIIYLITWK